MRSSCSIFTSAVFGNLYTVLLEEKTLNCHARGKFRKEKITPLVGDFCYIDEENHYILEIEPRKNVLERPNIANMDFALIVTSVKLPDLSLKLLDKTLSLMLSNKIEPIICFTKLDLLNEEEEKQIEKIIHYYKDCEYKVVKNTELDKIKRLLSGKQIVVTGQTGAGKSTLLNILAGLDKPSKGKVCIDGTDIFNLSEEKRTLLRREKIGFVFQAYELLHSLTVIENIRLPELTKDAQYVEELLDALKIRQYEKSYPDQLSGGEQQRTAIARALVNHPPILFADEPTGNLDSRTERVVIDLLKSLAAKYGTSILLVTHNEELVRDADRVIRLEDGEIVNG